MKFINLVLAACMLLTSALASAQFDSDDKLCADFMIQAFHAYAQYLHHETIDFCKPGNTDAVPALEWVRGSREALRALGFPTRATYIPSPAGYWNDWTFSPLEAKTGIKWCDQIYEACSATSWESNDFIGVIGFNPVEKKIVVAFRGTQKAGEWVGKNFNLIPGKIIPGIEGMGLSGIPIHRGYWEIISQLLPALEYQIRSYFASLPFKGRIGYQMYFTGHSLGGALATLGSIALAEELQDLLPSGMTLRSFAPPAVGGPELKAKVADLIDLNLLSAKSIVRDIDPVPNTPPKFLGYEQPVSPVVLESTPEEKKNCKSFPCRHDFRFYHRRIYFELGLGESYISPVERY